MSIAEVAAATEPAEREMMMAKKLRLMVSKLAYMGMARATVAGPRRKWTYWAPLK